MRSTLAEDVRQLLHPGDHLCMVYERPDHWVEAVSAFVRDALDDGACCLVMPHAGSESQLYRFLDAAGIDVVGARSSGALAVLAPSASYLRGGSFEPDRMLSFLADTVGQALRDGYTGWRLAAEPGFAVGGAPGADRVIEYEARLNDFFPATRAIGLCSYDRRRHPAALIRDVLRTHPVAIVDDVVCRNNLYYERPELVLERRSDHERVEWMARQLHAARRGQMALEEARRRAEDTAVALRRAARAKDEFLAMLAHELRNPLAAVRNAVVTATLDANRRETALAIARRQTDQLARLVDDLLDVARITQDKIALRRERTTLAALIARGAEAIRPQVAERGQTLEVSLPSEPAWLDADPTRLGQVLTNLLSNAVKFTPAGGRIVLVGSADLDRVVLRVRDTGAGIAPELLPRIFDLFTQGERGLDRAPGGLGVGLTIARKLIEVHGGTITAHSAGPGHGAEFEVTLPAAAPPSPAPLEAVRAAGAARGRPSVLVVEDDPDAADSLAMLLEVMGCDASVAANGPAALDAVHSARPDLMLVDIGLPGMDGYELVRRLRTLPTTRGVPVIALTGYGRAEDKEHARRAGFDEHMTKPLDPDALERLVSRIAREEPRHHELSH